MAPDPNNAGPLSDSSVPNGTESWKGKTLGRFKLLSELGKGAMGKVFRAEDINLKRYVALKVLPRKVTQGQKTYGLEQFFREARSAAKLEHPNVVQIYEIGEAGGVYYIAMELVEGGNLHGLVHGSGPMDYVKACQLGAEAAEALHYAHENGIVHRDVKPANLMLSRGGRCKLADFGLARLDDPSDSFRLPTEALGTPQYIAPEVAQGKPATPKSDIYSLGATMWYLLTRGPVYRSDSTQELLKMHVSSPIPDLKALRPDLPESLVRAIYKALAKKPEERYANADQFAKVLRAHTIPVSVHSMGPGSSMAGLIPTVGPNGTIAPPSALGIPPSQLTGSLSHGPLSHGPGSFGIPGDASATDVTTMLTPVNTSGSTWVNGPGTPGSAVQGSRQIPYAGSGSMPVHHALVGLSPWKFWSLIGVAVMLIASIAVLIILMMIPKPAALPPVIATQPVVIAPPAPTTKPATQPTTQVATTAPATTAPSVTTTQPQPATQPVVVVPPKPVVVPPPPAPVVVTPPPKPVVVTPPAPTPTPTPQPPKPKDPADFNPSPTSYWGKLAVTATFEASQTKEITEKAKKNDGDFVAIKGKIGTAKLGDQGTRINLKFEGTSSDSITCFYMDPLFPDMQKRFGGENGNGIHGQAVLIKGTLKLLYGLPLLKIDNIEQITVTGK